MARENVKLPKQGLPREKVLEHLDDLHEGDANWKEGRTWSLVYYAGEEHTSFLKSAYTKYFSENGLSPLAFPSIKKFETEVVAMTADILGGDENVTGTMTSCGTESILMAVKTHRDWFRSTRPEIKNPEMLLPATAHPAFEKAAHYFDVASVRIPVKADFRADVEAMRRAINQNTIMLVGSAPSYPHGVVDPIAELAAAAKERGLGMHVDSCLGGFLLPFVKKLGYPVPEFDFRVDGVTSISADIHKYGFAAKGASTVLYRNPDIRRHQFFVYTDWCGGVYMSPTMAGTRPAGSIAAAWATMQAMGEDGYLRNAKQIMSTTEALIKGISAIPGLHILGKPVMSVFAFTSDEFNVFALADAMEARGWHLDRQQQPSALHMMITLAHEKVVDQFLTDLRASVEHVKANPSTANEGSAPMYGMMATIPDRGMIRNFVFEAMDNIY
ncbi:MAG: aspartate aminotransferase family protein [Candidatus Abyssobacteria bacterium SURF_5]|uniref:Aspartate aminotransferase family protein n=1 Tax=Abyssobacteria bacterium (strain SURF_5) TaxID=2093360 RepID=A0A3A4P7M1_ABYX5|nr:MAG: aspartate aminotransferase family protein [Candidatus Abyssubacteria bacterium SURF_5]